MADPTHITEWRSIVGFPDYEVSSAGQVRRIGKPKHGFPPNYILSPFSHPAGYWMVVIRNGRNRARRLVHQLVAEAFIGQRPSPKHGVAHYDGNPQHNDYRNLRWATQAENIRDTIRHGRTNAGARSPHAVLTTDQVLEIRRRFTGKKGEIAALAREYGVHNVTMFDVVHRVNWRHLGPAE